MLSFKSWYEKDQYVKIVILMNRQSRKSQPRAHEAYPAGIVGIRDHENLGYLGIIVNTEQDQIMPCKAIWKYSRIGRSGCAAGFMVWTG